MRRWDFCGEHSHRTISATVMCMVKSGKWWTIMETDRFEPNAIVQVNHPVKTFGSPLDEAEHKDFRASLVGIQIIDTHNIRMAMHLMRAGEGSPRERAATRN